MDKRPSQSPCLTCGKNHLRSLCRFKAAICHQCGKKGHLVKVCRATLQDNTLTSPCPFRRSRGGSREDCFTISRDRGHTAVSISHASAGSSKKIHLTVKIEGAPCRMEVDTGSSKSIIAWSTLKKLVPSLTKGHLNTCNTRLRDYQRNHIPILGHGQFLVERSSFSSRFPIIVKGKLPSLLGLD